MRAINMSIVQRPSTRGSVYLSIYTLHLLPLLIDRSSETDATQLDITSLSIIIAENKCQLLHADHCFTASDRSDEIDRHDGGSFERTLEIHSLNKYQHRCRQRLKLIFTISYTADDM
jgi:hypothetical protein